MTIKAEPRRRADQDQARRRWLGGRARVWGGCLALVLPLMAVLGMPVLGALSARSLAVNVAGQAVASQSAVAALADARDPATPPTQAEDGSRWIYLASYPADALVQEGSLGVDRAMADDPVRAEGDADRADEPPLVSRVRSGRTLAGAD